MRIISFTKMWDKLKQPEFTTFRYPRGDKDWFVGEEVQVFYKNRSPNREKIGIAEIVKIEPRRILSVVPYDIPRISDDEAISDGFENFNDMVDWLHKTYSKWVLRSNINKLTLRWL